MDLKDKLKLGATGAFPDGKMNKTDEGELRMAISSANGFVRIDFPDHPIGDWQVTPVWLFWKPQLRRRHWRGTYDASGLICTYYWNYANSIGN